MRKRDLFEELMQGVEEMAARRSEAAQAPVAACCYQSAKDLDLNPSTSMTRLNLNCRSSSALTCVSSCTDQKAGRND